MEQSSGTPQNEEVGPFSLESGGVAHWQKVYASAVSIAQIMQRNGVDPYEATNFRPHEIHMIFQSARIYTFEEQLIFDVAVELLKHRHNWSYGS